MLLTNLRPGQWGRVVSLQGENHRLQELGFVQGAAVQCLFAAPAGDPVAYAVGGVTVALRREDARGIGLSEIWD